MDSFTRMMEVGLPPEGSMGAVKTPIFPASNFIFSSAEEMKRNFEVSLGRKKPRRGDENRFVYSRFSNPNAYLLEQKLTLLEEKARAALVFPSGMLAIFTVVFSLLKPGQAIIYTHPVYGCTEELFRHICAKYGIEAVSADTSNLKEMEKILRQHRGKAAMLFIETPANPNLRLSDIGSLAKLAGKYGSRTKKIWTVVDNTFMGPVFQKPLACGADIVVYSATKFLGGHSDLLAGAVLARRQEDLGPVRAYRDITGPTIAPFTAWMIIRSLETIEVRMQKQAQSAAQVAEFLSRHPRVEEVLFPGLLRSGDPQYEIYRKQCLGSGSMISFYLKNGNERKAFQLLNGLKIFKLAVSLGGTESLVTHPKSTTHLIVPAGILKSSGVTDGLIRLSVGLENPIDLIGDLRRALNKI